MFRLQQTKLIAHALFQVTEDYEKEKEKAPNSNMEKDSILFKLVTTTPESQTLN
jgi:hypothetical protein